jgi:hypothetical protein
MPPQVIRLADYRASHRARARHLIGTAAALLRALSSTY